MTKFDKQIYSSGLIAQGCWDELDSYTREAIYRFGELIVRECAEVADQWVDDEDNGHNLVSERLRQHFEVE